MIAAPPKATNEIDWVSPLKSYIRDTYGDDPERYAEECVTLNRLRQDMRGAGKESTTGRDMLYRYYGQLELLDLRFPVDEQHIKISFTWYEHIYLKPEAACHIQLPEQMRANMNLLNLGSMHSPTSLQHSTRSHSKKPPSSSTFRLFFLVTLPYRIEKTIRR